MAAATITMRMTSTFAVQPQHNSRVVKNLHKPVHSISIAMNDKLLLTTQISFQGSFNSCSFSNGLRSLVMPIFAVGSGLQTSIADPKENAIKVKNPKIAVESQDDNRILVRVDLEEEDTQIVFDKVLTNLARSAPPVPGFRRQKGGKTSNVPKDFLLQVIGEDRVMNFVIQEIVSSTLADYVKKENLNVKDNKVNTTQTADELKSIFTPGKKFGFNATLELAETTQESNT